MGYATEEKACMFFVGANDYKVNNDNAGATFAEFNYAGGCTKWWWDAKIAERMSAPHNETEVQAKEHVMGLLSANSGRQVGWVAMDADPIRINKTTGVYAGAEIGKVMYIKDYMGELGGDGMYEIVDVAPDNSWIEIDAPYARADDNFSVDVWIGGYHADLDYLCSNFIDTTHHEQEVWVNKDLAQTTSYWSFGNWSHSSDNYLRVIGFNRTPGDITETDGLFYQSINDIYKASGVVDTDCFVNVDQSNYTGEMNMITASTSSVIFKGFRTHGSTDLSLYSFDNFDAQYGIVEHCVFSVSSSAKKNATIWSFDAYSLRDCFIHGGETCVSVGMSATLEQCVVLAKANTLYTINSTMLDTTCARNSIIDATAGSYLGSHDSDVLKFDNCVLLGGTSGGFLGDANLTDGAFLFSGNIILMQLKQHLVVFDGSPTVDNEIRFINNCVYSVLDGGKLFTITWSGFSGRENYGYFAGNIEQDPQLKSDCMPHNKAVLFGGVRDIAMNRTTIGAVSQEHQYVSRSVNSNPGRIGIIR